MGTHHTLGCFMSLPVWFPEGIAPETDFDPCLAVYRIQATCKLE